MTPAQFRFMIHMGFRAGVAKILPATDPIHQQLREAEDRIFQAMTVSEIDEIHKCSQEVNKELNAANRRSHT